MSKLPAGVRCSLQVYMVSDASGVTAKINLSGMRALPTMLTTQSVFDNWLGAFAKANGIREFLGDDARPMTDEEITDYERGDKPEPEPEEDDPVH